MHCMYIYIVYVYDIYMHTWESQVNVVYLECEPITHYKELPLQTNLSLCIPTFTLHLASQIMLKKDTSNLANN